MPKRVLTAFSVRSFRRSSSRIHTPFKIVAGCRCILLAPTEQDGGYVNAVFLPCSLDGVGGPSFSTERFGIVGCWWHGRGSRSDRSPFDFQGSKDLGFHSKCKMADIMSMAGFTSNLKERRCRKRGWAPSQGLERSTKMLCW